MDITDLWIDPQSLLHMLERLWHLALLEGDAREAVPSRFIVRIEAQPDPELFGSFINSSALLQARPVIKSWHGSYWNVIDNPARALLGRDHTPQLTYPGHR